LRESEERKLYELITAKNIDYSDVYEDITGRQLSDDEARKRIYGIRDLLESKTSSIETTNPVEYTVNSDGSREIKQIINIPVSESEMKAQDLAKDEKFLLEKHGLDKDKWEITRAQNSMWTTQRKDGQLVTSFASKIKVKPKTHLTKEDIYNYFKDLNLKSLKVKKIKTSGKYMLEISIFDLHFGKLCWHGETGENFDIEIARKRYLHIINDIINKYNLPIEKILFVIGQDFFNYDNVIPTTTAGTQQDTDVRWKKMFFKGYELVIQSIELLFNSFQIPIEIYWIPGNHDEMTSFYLLHVLANYFRNNENIKVDLSAKERKYIQYGVNGIGFAHKLLKKNQWSLFQSEAPKIWGNTKYREFHLGHQHREIVNSKHGLVIRSLPCITGTDNWHYSQGYVGTKKAVQTFLWHKEKGLTDTKYHKIRR